LYTWDQNRSQFGRFLPTTPIATNDPTSGPSQCSDERCDQNNYPERPSEVPDQEVDSDVLGVLNHEDDERDDSNERNDDPAANPTTSRHHGPLCSDYYPFAIGYLEGVRRLRMHKQHGDPSALCCHGSAWLMSTHRAAARDAGREVHHSRTGERCRRAENRRQATGFPWRSRNSMTDAVNASFRSPATMCPASDTSTYSTAGNRAQNSAAFC
jgi:hypothetical protein